MKKLILLVAIVLMTTNISSVQDSTIMAQAYRDSVHQAKVTRNRALAATQKAERKSLRTFEANQPFKTKFTLGFNVMAEAQVNVHKRFTRTAVPNFGIPFEVQFTRHSALETGLYYRNVVFPEKRSYQGYDLVTQPQTNQRYLSLPILYKFHSRILNFSIGFNIDYMIDNSITKYDIHGKELDELFLGIMFKLSKEFVLVKGLVAEPTLYINPYTGIVGPPFRLAWMGGSLALKYRF